MREVDESCARRASDGRKQAIARRAMKNDFARSNRARGAAGMVERARRCGRPLRRSGVSACVRGERRQKERRYGSSEATSSICTAM
ncbi:hypothetical protein C7S17_5028 [Burkholderia thailandensis]|nr:hypothetical protein [Burkholderia thailandensis]